MKRSLVYKSGTKMFLARLWEPISVCWVSQILHRQSIQMKLGRNRKKKKSPLFFFFFFVFYDLIFYDQVFFQVNWMALSITENKVKHIIGFFFFFLVTGFLLLWIKFSKLTTKFISLHVGYPFSKFVSPLRLSNKVGTWI